MLSELAHKKSLSFSFNRIQMHGAKASSRRQSRDLLFFSYAHSKNLRGTREQIKAFYPSIWLSSNHGCAIPRNLASSFPSVCSSSCNFLNHLPPLSLPHSVQGFLKNIIFRHRIPGRNAVWNSTPGHSPRVKITHFRERPLPRSDVTAAAMDSSRVIASRLHFNTRGNTVLTYYARKIKDGAE